MTSLRGNFVRFIFSPWGLAAFLYGIAHGFALFSLEPVLDDFIVYRVPMEEMARTYRMEGYWHFLPLLKTYFALPSLDLTVFAFRVSIFAAFLASAAFLNGVLKTVDSIDAVDRYFLVALVMVMPLDCGRNRFCLSHYFASHFLFYLGFWLTARYFRSRHKILRAFALAVFFLSFFTPSFLVFYAVVLLYVVHADAGLPMTLRKSAGSLVRHADFVALPAVFWIARRLFFMPSGWRDHYNEVSLATLMRSPVLMLEGAVAMAQGVFRYSTDALGADAFIAVVAAAVVFLWLARTVAYPKGAGTSAAAWFFFGVGLCFIGLFPYAAVGKAPDFLGGASRHALLLPLGGSFTSYFGLKCFLERLGVNPKVRLCAFSVVLVAFTTASARGDMEYLLDGYKKLALVAHFKESAVLRDHATFLFEDETSDLDARGMPLTWLEYTGLLDWAFGGQKRLGVEDPALLSDPNRFARLQFYSAFERHHFSRYAATEPPRADYRVTIKPGTYAMNPRRIIKFVLFRMLRPEQFAADLKNMIRLDFEKT